LDLEEDPELKEYNFGDYDNDNNEGEAGQSIYYYLKIFRLFS
jgi:hypothetical protein